MLNVKWLTFLKANYYFLGLILNIFIQDSILKIIVLTIWFSFIQPWIF